MFGFSAPNTPDLADTDAARLARAAPELYEVANKVDIIDKQARHVRKDSRVVVDYLDWKALVALAKAAVAKAEGRE